MSYIKEIIPVEEFALKKNMTPQEVIVLIQDGQYKGRNMAGKWYIFESELDKTVEKVDSELKVKISTAESESKKLNEECQSVVVTDIKMPFQSMVIFMIKWALASIPAIIVLGIIFAILGSIFGGIFFHPSDFRYRY